MRLDVYLAPGHGRHPDTGRIDEGTRDGDANEQRDGDWICRAAERRLTDHWGAIVYRQPRGGPDFRGTIPDILRRDPRVAVEVHHDWVRAPRGGFGFWRTRDQHRLALKIHEAYRQAGLPRRPHMIHLPGTSSPPAIVRRTRAVLWEADRIGAVTDHALYGRVLADGIADYLGLTPTKEDDVALTPDQERALSMIPKLAVDVDAIRTSLGSRPNGKALDDLGRIRRTLRAVAGKVGVDGKDVDV